MLLVHIFPSPSTHTPPLPLFTLIHTYTCTHAHTHEYSNFCYISVKLPHSCSLSISLSMWTSYMLLQKYSRICCACVSSQHETVSLLHGPSMRLVGHMMYNISLVDEQKFRQSTKCRPSLSPPIYSLSTCLPFSFLRGLKARVRFSRARTEIPWACPVWFCGMRNYHMT